MNIRQDRDKKQTKSKSSAYNEMMNDEDEERINETTVCLVNGNDSMNLPTTTMIYDGVEADDTMAYIPTTHL